MPLSFKSRVLSQVASPQQEVSRTAELRPVHDAFAWFQSHAVELNKTQIEMVRIPAPPFGEAKRAEWNDYRIQVTPWELDRYLMTY